jgi:hypothetical protein
MASLRLWHSYLSVFIAPSVIFFALTGALQLFDLHEAHAGYQPPAMIEKFGRLHKDQVFAAAEHRRSAPTGLHDEAKPKADEDGEDEPRSALRLKWFFLFVSVLLATSTGLGLWIGLTHVARKRLSALLLAGGCLIPLAVLAI